MRTCPARRAGLFWFSYGSQPGRCSWLSVGDVVERVLVVDDDTTVRDVVRRYLEHAGYEVELAGDGAELAALEPRLREMRLAILETALPAGRCAALLRRLRELRPELCVVLLGDAAAGQFSDPEWLADPRCARVRKPFLPAHLQDTIRRLLGDAADAESNRVPEPPPDTRG